MRAFRPAAERRIDARFGIIRPTTDAVRRLRAGQENTDAWLDARTATIGASEISVLMLDQHPYHSLFSLFHVKRSGWGRHAPSPVQERGHWLEQGIAGKFADHRPDLVVGRPNGALWCDPALPWMSCTPDFLTIGEDGLIIPLETKSDEGGDGWGDGPEDVPAHHWWQVQQQCGVFAAPYGYLARWSSRGFRVYRIDYDHKRYVAAAHQARGFLDDVQSGREPEPDGHDSTREVLTDMYDPTYVVRPVRVPDEWGAELSALKESRKEIERQIKDLTNKIRAMMGDAPTAYDLSGRVHARSITERKGFTAKPSTVDQLRTIEPRETP